MNKPFVKTLLLTLVVSFLFSACAARKCNCPKVQEIEQEQEYRAEDETAEPGIGV